MSRLYSFPLSEVKKIRRLEMLLLAGALPWHATILACAGGGPHCASGTHDDSPPVLVDVYASKALLDDGRQAEKPADHVLHLPGPRGHARRTGRSPPTWWSIARASRAYIAPLWRHSRALATGASTRSRGFRAPHGAALAGRCPTCNQLVVVCRSRNTVIKVRC
jgi:hypothetical protein